jgi:hypothetical protein
MRSAACSTSFIQDCSLKYNFAPGHAVSTRDYSACPHAHTMSFLLLYSLLPITCEQRWVLTFIIAVVCLPFWPARLLLEGRCMERCSKIAL